MGLGKNRSRLGEWLDERGIKQNWLEEKSESNKTTIGKVCNDSNFIPTGKTIQKIIKALRDVDPSVRADMFWDI